MGKLLDLPPEQLAKVDVAEMNLLCATGLPGAEHLDVAASLQTLDAWADHVAQEIARRRPRFFENPAKYDQSENLFKMVMLILTLKEDLQVHYDPAMMGVAAQPGATQEQIEQDLADDHYFKDSAGIFLHGIFSAAHTGTCSSLPVLYVAVGRRLGFPLKLVPAKGHLFVRWDDGHERFNIEGTGGVDSLPDDYYKKWPLPISPEELATGSYLKSLSPAEELAVFLESRACCLRANDRFDEALVASAQGYRLWPNEVNSQIGLAQAAEAVTASLRTAPAPAPAIDPIGEMQRVEATNRELQDRLRRINGRRPQPTPAPFPWQEPPAAPLSPKQR